MARWVKHSPKEGIARSRTNLGPCVQPQSERARTSAQPSADVQNEDREIRTPNLLIWSQTRYRCAISPVPNRAHCHSSDTIKKKRLSTTPLMQNNSPHWGLNPGPSVYKTDALPLSYRGDGPRISRQSPGKPNHHWATTSVPAVGFEPTRSYLHWILSPTP